MRLVRIRHKGLRRLYADDDTRALSPPLVDKIRKQLFALEAAQSLVQVGRFPGWKLHALKGQLAGYWSLTVTGNWRLVFRYDEAGNVASDLDLVDYH